MSVVIRVIGTLIAPGYARLRAYGLAEGDPRVELYAAAVEGVRYVKPHGDVLTLDVLRVVLDRLAADGFDVALDPELEVALGAEVARTDAHVTAAEARLDTIDRRIYETTLAQFGVGSHLFPYQRRGVLWLAERRAALLADEMRLGKTLTVIAALPDNARALVVCPSGVKGVWRGQVARYRPEIRVTVLAGRASFRWSEPGELVVMNYEILPPPHVDGCDGKLPAKPCRGCRFRVGGTGARIRDGHHPGCKGFEKRKVCPGCNPILTAPPRGVAVVDDEAHLLKNPAAQRTKSFRKLARAAREADGSIWLLTGTPLENQPPDLWNVLSCADLGEEAFGSYGDFAFAFDAKQAGYKRPGMKYRTLVWGAPKPEVGEKLQRVMLRRVRADVLPELPRKLYDEIIVDLDEDHLRSVEALFAETGWSIDALVEAIATSGRVRPSASEASAKSEALGLKIQEFSAMRAALAAAKIPFLVEYVNSLDEQDATLGPYENPLVVFSAHRTPVLTLGNRPGWACITGDQSAEEKTEIVARFQRGELRGVALTIRSGGVGIELSRSSHVIFCDRDWNPAANWQAEDRPMGMNQRRGVQITTFVATHPLDARVHATLMRKLAIIAASVDAANVAA